MFEPIYTIVALVYYIQLTKANINILHERMLAFREKLHFELGKYWEYVDAKSFYWVHAGNL